MKRKTIRVSELKMGMRIILPSSWVDHPFLKSTFVISSQDQIQKLVEHGFEKVIIDASTAPPEEKGAIAAEVLKPSPPHEWEPDKLVPADLKEAIRDKNLSSDEKAAIVYKSSITMMERLLEDPKAENIRQVKREISGIVDLIVSDAATARSLLAITAYDFYTYTHSVNVGVLSIMLSKELIGGSYAHDLHELGAGFFLHDIGKVRIDPAILNKPSRLTDEEMKIMKAHPFQGYKILREANQLTEECRIIVMQHHERSDGGGYPNRLKGSEIHLYGRICCIADVYDALTADRPYKKRLNPFEALKIMKEDMLTHFHRELFDKFVLLFA